MNKSQFEKLDGMLKDLSTVMLITMDESIGCHARPKEVARLAENSDLWFFASLDAATVREIEADSRVQIHGQGKCSTYMVLVGHATVVHGMKSNTPQSNQTKAQIRFNDEPHPTFRKSFKI
jgi:general stress protein 26